MPIEPLNLEVLHETTREVPAHEIPANHQWTATERQDGVWERKDTVGDMLRLVAAAEGTSEGTPQDTDALESSTPVDPFAAPKVSASQDYLLPFLHLHSMRIRISHLTRCSPEQIVFSFPHSQKAAVLVEEEDEEARSRAASVATGGGIDAAPSGVSADAGPVPLWDVFSKLLRVAEIIKTKVSFFFL